MKKRSKERIQAIIGEILCNPNFPRTTEQVAEIASRYQVKERHAYVLLGRAREVAAAVGAKKGSAPSLHRRLAAAKNGGGQ